MYTKLSKRGALGGRGLLFTVLLVVGLVAQGGAAAPPLEVDTPELSPAFDELNPEANSTRVWTVEWADEPALPSDPAEVEMLLRERTSCPCLHVGNVASTYSKTNAFRGNIYTVDPAGSARTLCRFKMNMNAPAGTELCFYVFRCTTSCTSATSQYQQIWSNTVLSPAAGMRLQDSGAITGVVLQPGDKFALGVAWKAVSVQYQLDSTQYPDTAPEWGTTEGSFGKDSTPCPVNATQTLTRITGGAYVQEVCFEPPAGACCVGTGCEQLTPDACAAAGGHFTAGNVSCAAVACPLIEGACCFNASCYAYNVYECAALLGTYKGAPPSEPLMGDINTNGILDGQDYEAFRKCLEYSGGPIGFPAPLTCDDVCSCDTNGIRSCDTNGLYADLAVQCRAECVCAIATLVCSNGAPTFDPEPFCRTNFDYNFDDRVDLADFAGSLDFAGFSLGFGIQPDACAFNPCAGACCLFDGSCDDGVNSNGLTESACLALDGTWHPGLKCREVDCNSRGACCSGFAPCEELEQAECEKKPSPWKWCESVHCAEQDCNAPVTCTPTGACCHHDGTCDILTQNECVNTVGGTWHQGQDCTQAACVATEACCFYPSLGCIDLPPAQCTAAIQGRAQGPGTLCDTITMCDLGPGACCFESVPHNCLDLSAYDCQATGVACWGGVGTACASFDCTVDINTNGVIDICE
jgi:hypothetical protein